MEPSYHHLAQAYDQLFPLDPEALSLVVDGLGSGTAGPVVDAGCGTGLLVRALANTGIRAHGFDLDPDLLAIAQSSSVPLASFSSDDLRTFTLPPGFPAPRLVASLGNTLPHLLEEADLDAFFDRSRRALSPGGTLILQVLDYDHLSREGIRNLPEKKVGPWTFRRRYEVQPSGLWRFITNLEWPGGQSSAAFDLKPWSRHDLETSLARQGLRVDGVWGGFDRRPPGHSLPLVLQAKLL